MERAQEGRFGRVSSSIGLCGETRPSDRATRYRDQLDRGLQEILSHERSRFDGFEANSVNRGARRRAESCRPSPCRSAPNNAPKNVRIVGRVTAVGVFLERQVRVAWPQPIIRSRTRWTARKIAGHAFSMIAAKVRRSNSPQSPARTRRNDSCEDD